MAASVTLTAGEAVFAGSTVVDFPETTVPMVDNSGGSYNGTSADGHYTISISSSGQFVVTYGTEPSQSPTLLNIFSVDVLGGSVQNVADRRQQNVTIGAVNSTVMAVANADGSYLASGVVTERTLSAAVLALLGTGVIPHGTSFPGTAVDAQLFFRDDLQLLAVYTGSTWLYVNGVIPTGASLPASGVEGELFYRTSGTISLYVYHSSSWVTVGGGGGGGPTTITYGTSYPGSPVDGELFYRTDLGYLFVYESGSSSWVQCSPSPVLTLNGLTGAVSITDATNGGVAVATSGSNVVLTVEIASGTSNPGTAATGQLFYRTDLTELLIYNGSAWVAVLPGGAGGVSSLNSLTGALAIAAVANGGANVGTSGSNVNLKVAIPSGTSEPASPYAGQLFYRTDTTTLEIYNGSAWVAVVATGAGGVSSLNSLTGAVTIADASNGGIVVATSGSNVNLTVAIATGTSNPGTATAGQLFYRTDLTELLIYTGSAWVTVLPAGAGGVSSLNSLTGALSIAATSNGGISVAASGSNVNLKVAVATGTSEPASPYTGQLFYRTDTGNLEIYNGSAWQPVLPGGAGGVSSLNTLTGALAVAGTTNGGIVVATSGSNVNLTVEIATGTSYPASPATGQMFYRTDLPQLSIYNGSAWVAVVPVSTPAISLTSGAGVPTASGSFGDIYRSTDGTPGMALWSYVGSYTGLPYVINWGAAAVTSTGNVTVTMQRNMTNGSTLIAFGGWQVGAIGQTLATGWTSIFSNAGPTPAVSAAWKANTLTGNTVTITNATSSGDLPAMFFVIEIANANSTPIANSASGGSNTSLASQSKGNLALFFGANSSGMGGSDFAPLYTYQNIIGGALAASMYTLKAVPLVSPVINPTPSSLNLYGLGMTAVGIVCVAAAASGTTQLWTPYA